MRIMVVGAGKVGATTAEYLAQEEHDVVVVDQDVSVLEHIQDKLDVLCLKGNGANAQTLISAGIDRVDILIATTNSDEVNMLCCLIGKRLGAKYAIARIRDPEYNESQQMLQQQLGIDMTINPERATALEISRLLRYPFASNIETFAKGRVEMVGFRVQNSDPLVGESLRDFMRIHRDLPRVLYAAVERNGEVFIPNGDFIFEAGDHVHVAGDMVTITNYFWQLGRNMTKVKNVMLLGGSRISYYLAKMVLPMGTKVKIFEIVPEKARRLSELLPDADIIQGDGTDQDLLSEENLTDQDAFIALCDRDEENLMTGLYASHQNVPKVIVKNNRLVYSGLVEDMGLDSIVSPKSITCATILRYVRGRVNGQGTKVEKLYRLMNDKAEALEFIARGTDRYIGVALKDLKLKKNTLVAVIVHDNKVIVPFGNDHIEAGDIVIIMTRESGIRDLNEVLRV